MVLGVAALSRRFPQRERILLLLGEEQLQLAEQSVQECPGLYGRGESVEVIPALPPAGEELGA